MSAHSNILKKLPSKLPPEVVAEIEADEEKYIRELDKTVSAHVNELDKKKKPKPPKKKFARLDRGAGDWDEGEHPRDDHGRFTDAGGGDGGAAAKPAPKEPVPKPLLERVPDPPLAALRQGLDTVAYHATTQDFEEFKPGAWRGATFFGPTPKAAWAGAAAGRAEAVGETATEQAPVTRIVGVYLRSQDIAGLSLTPAEKSWWNGLPERTDDKGLTAAMKDMPKNFEGWYDAYEEINKGNDVFEYVKRPMPEISYEQAQRTGRDVYGKAISHWGPETSEKTTAERVRSDGMSGWIVSDEAGISIAHIDPSREKLRLASDFAEETTAPKEPESDKLLLVSEQPNKEKVDAWTRQLDDREKELEQQGKGGGTTHEDDENTKMQVSLKNYTLSSKEELDSETRGFNAVYDGDNTLLAAAFSSFDPETKVAQINTLGAIDPDARVKTIQQIINRYMGERTATPAARIEALTWDDRPDIIKAFEDAGFKTKKGTYVTSLVTMVYGKPEPTPEEVARAAKIAGEHSAKILGASQATARLLGYDPKLVDVSDEPYTFALGGSQRTAAGLAYTQTGKIVIFPKSVYSTDAAVNVTTHEVAHQKYQTVLDAVRKEELLAIEKVPTGGMNPDGSLVPPYDKQYPLYSRFHKHELTFQKRKDDDGITPYSIDWWQESNTGKASVRQAEHETIAEMASESVQTGHLKGSKEWKAYYKDIMKTYDELKKAKKS